MKREATQRRNWSIAMAAAAAFAAVATLGFEYQDYRCEAMVQERAGQCTGRPGPTGCGSVNVVQYDGCHHCVPAPGNRCSGPDSPWMCRKRTQVIPCVTNELGYCVEGPAQEPGPWELTPEDYCE